MGSLGVLFCGSGGAVATTAASGLALLEGGHCDDVGLPLAAFDQAGLAPYGSIRVAGWDLFEADTATAARHHGVVPQELLSLVEPELSKMSPFPAITFGNGASPVHGSHVAAARDRRHAVELVKADIETFRRREGLSRLVMINLASVEPSIDVARAEFASLASLEAALDADAPCVTASMVYAYAAISEGIPFGNFTPSGVLDIPALRELADKHRTPLAGKDGKTGQTLLKAVIAPAMRARNLQVDGWYSTNLLGNRDGLALSDPDLRSSKIATKTHLLDDLLGYPVADHLVEIAYYRPRGDNKESWDSIDIRGFLGQTMQIKINFLCRDSILAAPLVIELARLLDLAAREGRFGVQAQLSAFFKAPYSAAESPPAGFYSQHELLMAWLAGRRPDSHGASAHLAPLGDAA